MITLDTSTKRKWSIIVGRRGMKKKCHEKTGLSRMTIDRALNGEAIHPLIYDRLKKFFNKQKP